jgi:hypothetical protein
MLALVIAAALPTTALAEDKVVRPRPTVEAIGRLSAQGGASTWSGDPAAVSNTQLGARIMDTGALYLGARLGYAPVNDRLIQAVSLGAMFWARIGITRPFFRIGAVHQHEQSFAAINKDPGAALLGVGDGIRHRGGAEAALGLDIPFHRDKEMEVVATIEASTPYFWDDRGPRLYVLGGVGLGVHYGLK